MHPHTLLSDSAPDSSSDAPTLESLPPELIAAIGAHVKLPWLGRFACCCAAVAGAVRQAEEAWAAVWASLTGGVAPAPLGARAAVRSLLTLDQAHWRSLPGSSGEAPDWRQHGCVLTCSGGTRLILFGGRDGRRFFCDTWACDLASGAWVRVAAHSDARCPSPRCFNSDSGGGRVLRSGEEEWAVLHGGLCAPGYRDSQTWLLGPLSHPPEEWSWLPASPPDHVEGAAPVARFHHTLTLLPRREAAGDDSLALLGGHDRTISPLLDLRLFSLRHASLPRKASGVAAASVSVGWSRSTHVLGPAPSPRAFHSAAHYDHPAAGRGLLLACCGLGPAAGGEEVFAALDDTWAFDLSSGRWLELAARLPHGFARSRAALAVSRDRLLLAGGCRARAPALATYLPLTPGPAFDDVSSSRS
ncbi:hypothetical protein EMIHUDRAFT_233445 [Emiliania huxleyi CCMP1516]|uniref:F-box domain-containing protein n=2 Tax=Emiliania huxleyi TaxID=2903 RepID=A0A0D3K285_EMIH1|nr:hypothetical protein EMIHUDRAFT_233445 [Emiliania huxleyi CCMP1516]EOD29870.1 hypothetical protein EMIHUDRAFT_233445 [Emiliania huxleyi CCMP1516]|eukprot:XP_005782299.1 hypothetical protein EMIHUDRAFT_233445 [Emiliania huxleyi CCMP1516]